MSKSIRERALEALSIGKFKVPDTWEDVLDVLEAVGPYPNEQAVDQLLTALREAKEILAMFDRDLYERLMDDTDLLDSWFSKYSKLLEEDE